MAKWPEHPKDIYDFAYSNREKIVAPKRHWRHAIDLGKGGTYDLRQDFGHQTNASEPDAKEDKRHWIHRRAMRKG